MMKRTPEVLLIDDNPADVDLANDALARSHVPHRVTSLADGVEALAFLRRQGRFTDASLPDLMILDLNLPRKDGRAVLAEIKRDPELHRLPVVIFSTSQAQTDIGQSYNLGANSYVCKPGNLHEYLLAVQSISEFWCGCACLPPKGEV